MKVYGDPDEDRLAPLWQSLAAVRGGGARSRATRSPRCPRRSAWRPHNGSRSSTCRRRCGGWPGRARGQWSRSTGLATDCSSATPGPSCQASTAGCPGRGHRTPPSRRQRRSRQSVRDRRRHRGRRAERLHARGRSVLTHAEQARVSRGTVATMKLAMIGTRGHYETVLRELPEYAGRSARRRRRRLGRRSRRPDRGLVPGARAFAGGDDRLAGDARRHASGRGRRVRPVRTARRNVRGGDPPRRARPGGEARGADVRRSGPPADGAGPATGRAPRGHDVQPVHARLLHGVAAHPRRRGRRRPADRRPEVVQARRPPGVLSRPRDVRRDDPLGRQPRDRLGALARRSQGEIRLRQPLRRPQRRLRHDGAGGVVPPRAVRRAGGIGQHRRVPAGERADARRRLGPGRRDQGRHGSPAGVGDSGQRRQRRHTSRAACRATAAHCGTSSTTPAGGARR